ncbi:hypothetical protein [Mycobacterium phage WXIN]|nr:hypothetical protein [Mycobacterium phage WXIN]
MARDPELRPRAKAVALYLWSLPDGWELSIDSIAVATGLDKRTAAAAIGDLIAARWLRRDEIANQHGRVFEYVYVIHQSRRFSAKNAAKNTPPKKNEKRGGGDLASNPTTRPSGSVIEGPWVREDAWGA